MKAAIYCRISLDRTGEGAGVTRQLEDCTTLVDQQGWTLYEVYTDNDISASSGKPRPNYRRMLKDIENGAVDVIVAWHPDRLYRKLTDLEELIKTVDKRDVLIRTVRAGEFDLATPTGKMLARILASVSQGEGDIKADRWKRSVRQRREKGVFAPSGPRMYGWTREGEVIEDEKAVVEWMADEMIRGTGVVGLARKMEQRGILTTTGKFWQVQSVRRYLANPKIAGHATLNGAIIGKGDWKPLLDEETWETVRAKVNAKSRKQPPRVALLGGLLYCGECGGRMVTGARMNKRGETVRVYRCTRVPGGNGCGKISGRADAIEEVVEAYARQRLDNERTRASVAKFLASPREHSAEIVMLEARIQELEHELDKPGVPAARINRAINRAEERLAELQQEIAATIPTELPARGGDWPEDLARRRALVEIVVERVTLAPATQTGVFDPARVDIKRRRRG